MEDQRAALARAVRDLAKAHGFELGAPFATRDEMMVGVRSLDEADVSVELDDIERRALLENFRWMLLRTASTPRAEPSLRAQSLRGRWRFLRQTSSDAANLYVAVLGYFGLEVPNYLRDDAHD